MDEKRLTKKEIDRIKRIEKGIKRVIGLLSYLTKKDRNLINFFAEMYGKKAIDYEQIILNLMQLSEGCQRTIEQETNI